MLTSDLLAFVRASLPEPPSRILEIGAGKGELARELRDAGYEVTAIDPNAEPDSGVEPISLLEASGEFNAAVAVVSLHHLDPLQESCAHLATLIEPGGKLVLDEIDAERYDERAAAWWLSQRRALATSDDDAGPSDLVQRLRGHVHPLDTVCAALRPYFDVGHAIPVAYLHRWELRPSLREAEVELIAAGLLPATGARLVAVRKS
ncbi:MAG: class I SAM-dependent methyltransferase [Solirubrobacteraceae bacterium]